MTSKIMIVTLYRSTLASVCILNYGVLADATDEDVYIGDRTTTESLRRFVGTVVDVSKSTVVETF